MCAYISSSNDHIYSTTIKALEQQTGSSDDFQGTGTDGKEAPKRKFTMEPAMEDKICDLYDLYADVLFYTCNPLQAFYSFSFCVNSSIWYACPLISVA